MLDRWPQYLLGWLLALVFTSAQAEVLRDDRGQPIATDAPARRIVSLLPSLTETVCVLGACERLVGVDRYSNWPQRVQSLPRVGGGMDPQLETIMALRPDVVLMATSSPGGERLQALGLRVVWLEPHTWRDVQRTLQVLTRLLGLPVARGDEVWQGLQDEVARVAQTLPPTARSQRVYIEVSTAPHGASAASFMGETLQRLGPQNILGTEMGPFPAINPELVVRAQPDVILAADTHVRSLLARPGWAQLRAVRQQRLCTYSESESDVLVRPGPRMAEAARLMARCFLERP